MTHATTERPLKADNESLVERLKRNRSGALVAGLVVMLVTAIILSKMITVDFSDLWDYEATGERVGSWMVIFSGLLVAAATGYAVRLTSPRLNAAAMLIAGILSWVGVHIMTMVATGTSILGDPAWKDESGAGAEYVRDSGLGDSLLFSLVTPAFAAGSILAAVAAAIVVGWGDRD